MTPRLRAIGIVQNMDQVKSTFLIDVIEAHIKEAIANATEKLEAKHNSVSEELADLKQKLKRIEE